MEYNDGLLRLCGFAGEFSDGVAGRGVRDLWFSRGFVRQVRGSAYAFIHRGREWCERTPLRVVRLTSAACRAARLAACPHLAALIGLVIEDAGFGDTEAAALAASPHLAGLTALDLSRSEVGDGGLVALATSPHLTGLSYLRLVSCHVTAAGLHALAGTGCGPCLRLLNLSGNPLGGLDVELVGRLFDRHPPLMLELRGDGIPVASREELSDREPGPVFA